MEFETALHALCHSGANFVVIGGVSASLHGGAHLTYDLDICCLRDDANLQVIPELESLLEASEQ
jgi:hypothetical protein